MKDASEFLTCRFPDIENKIPHSQLKQPRIAVRGISLSIQLRGNTIGSNEDTDGGIAGDTIRCCVVRIESRIVGQQAN